MTEQTITDEQSTICMKRLADFLVRFNGYRAKRKTALNSLQLIQEGEELKLVNEKYSKYPKWIRNILSQENGYHEKFFGSTFDLTSFAETLNKYGKKKINMWKKLGMEPHFLQKVSMMDSDHYPGWKVKPKRWYYDQLADGKLFREIDSEIQKLSSVGLEGISGLVDTRLKPFYGDGEQMWADDDNLIGLVIKQLRNSGKIAKYDHGPKSSRFGISAKEWEDKVKLHVANNLCLNVKQVRLETTIERNVIPQIYSAMSRKDDGITNTSVWVEEFLEGCEHRLDGGYSGNGGLADVGCRHVGDHWDGGSFRPLVVLQT